MSTVHQGLELQYLSLSHKNPVWLVLSQIDIYFLGKESDTEHLRLCMLAQFVAVSQLYNYNRE